MKAHTRSMALLLAIIIAGSNQAARVAADSFVNCETPPVHPSRSVPTAASLRSAIWPMDGWALRREFRHAVPVGSVPVGLDPVSVRYRTTSEAWVVNHISDSISVVNVTARQVVATLRTLDTPADVIFAGSAGRAFVSCATPNTVQVFDAVTRQLVTNLVIQAERPKALAVSPDGSQVYAAISASGNGPPVLGPGSTALRRPPAPTAPAPFTAECRERSDQSYGGQNPPPNSGTSFSPAIAAGGSRRRPAWSFAKFRGPLDGRQCPGVD
jgi:YVTN family beta-propeller protein